MPIGDATGLFLGAILLGFIHGIEPGHGWPVAATYALDQSNKWLHGFAASFLLGFGHLVSSIAMVAVFFWAKNYFGLTQIGWMNYVAGVLLIALGIREYFHGHSHDHGNGHDHDEHEHSDDHDHAHGHDGHDHSHDEHERNHQHNHSPRQFSAEPAMVVNDSGQAHHEHGAHGHTHDDHGHDHGSEGLFGRIKSYIPFVGGHSHSHDHGSMEEASDRGLLGIAGFAFVLGFAHEEEFEIIALCAGSNYCLELMSVYAITVIFGIVGLTLLLIAGYTHYEERVERYTEYLPTFSAAVLILMGVGFIVGVF